MKPMPGNHVTPSLAESWTVSPDQRAYEFKLREGLKQQAREMDRKKREALLHHVQQIMNDRVRIAPIFEYIWPSGVGPRVADPA